MRGMNFYINVDQCLDMSNYDMFFYKLQSRHKFFVTDCNFNAEPSKEDSMQKACDRVKSYMDQSPVLLRDYRIVFGMRQDYKKAVNGEPSWTDSILYRLLKVHYSLTEAKIFIRVKDVFSDRNVTVIMLYNVDNTFDEKELPSEEYSSSAHDLPLLLRYLGYDSQEYATEKEIVEWMKQIMNSDSGRKLDDITLRFIREYCAWYDMHDHNPEIRKKRDLGKKPNEGENRDEEENDIFMDEESLEIEEEILSREITDIYDKRLVARFDSLLYYIKAECIGHFCVFIKNVSKIRGENHIGLLSVVDYITTGLVRENDGKKYTNANLREQAKNNWKRARDPENILEKYGTMLFHYEKALEEEKEEVSRSVNTFEDKLIMEDELEDTEIMVEFSSEEYQKKISEILNGFKNKGFFNSGALGSWKNTVESLKKQTERMEERLETYANELSIEYKTALDQRKKEKIHNTAIENGLYDPTELERHIREYEKKKIETFEELKRPRMNPSLRYQDQLNVENAMRKCDLEMKYLIGCKEKILLARFWTMLLICGGIPFVHHILLQGSMLDTIENLIGFALSMVIVLLLMIFTWRAPIVYYRNEMNRALKELEEEIQKYTTGYTERAENFKAYINGINKLDIINVKLKALNTLMENTKRNSKNLLEHKVYLGEHINKCKYFDILYKEDSDIKPENFNRHSVPLNPNKKVYQNHIYWPDRKQGDSKWEN